MTALALRIKTYRVKLIIVFDPPLPGFITRRVRRRLRPDRDLAI